MNGNKNTPPNPPLYIPPSFLPTNLDNNHYNQNSSPAIPPLFPSHPPLYIPPSFPPPNLNQQSMPFQPNLNRNQSPFLSMNNPENVPNSSNLNRQVPLQPPLYIPPAFHPSELEQYNSNPRIRGTNRNINNQKITELLEDVEITEQVLNKNVSKSCIICMEDFEIGEKICYLPCFHFFHSECIKPWTQKSDKCPICKAIIKFE